MTEPHGRVLLLAIGRTEPYLILNSHLRLDFPPRDDGLAWPLLALPLGRACRFARRLILAGGATFASNWSPIAATGILCPMNTSMSGSE
jgi:hypothetical protein